MVEMERKRLVFGGSSARLRQMLGGAVVAMAERLTCWAAHRQFLVAREQRGQSGTHCSFAGYGSQLVG